MAAHFFSDSYDFMVFAVIESKDGKKLPKYSGDTWVCKNDD
jgi:hypothetical protein